MLPVAFFAGRRGRAAEVFLQQLLAVNPTDEAAQQALVLSYLARGRRDLARRQVSRWQAALAEEEMILSPETVALWHQVDD